MSTGCRRLDRDLAAGQKVFLISPRRYGKSSLIRDVLRGLDRQKILTVEVTVASSSSCIGFLDSRFVASGMRPEDGLGAAIVDLAANVPYDVQRLAHETWDDIKAAGRKTVGLADLHATLTRLLGEQHTIFEESWQRLTLPQRAVLRALVLEDGRELLSADVRTLHGQRLPLSRMGGAADLLNVVTS